MKKKNRDFPNYELRAEKPGARHPDALPTRQTTGEFVLQNDNIFIVIVASGLQSKTVSCTVNGTNLGQNRPLLWV